MDYETAMACLIHWAQHVEMSERSASCAVANVEAAKIAREVPELAVLHPWAVSVIECAEFAKDPGVNREVAALVLDRNVCPDDLPTAA